VCVVRCALLLHVRTIFYWALDFCIVQAFLLRRKCRERIGAPADSSAPGGSEGSGQPPRRSDNITAFRLELASNLIAAATKQQSGMAAAGGGASSAAVDPAGFDDDDNDDLSDPDFVPASDSGDSASTSSDEDSGEHSYVDLTRGRPAGAVKRNTARAAEPGHAWVAKLLPVPKGSQHRCSVCTSTRATLYCVGCDRFFCLKGERLCYNDAHPVSDEPL
jgi:hypothetical protein